MKKSFFLSAFLCLNVFLFAQSNVHFKGNDFPITGYKTFTGTLKEMEYVQYENYLGYNEKENLFVLTTVQTFGENKNMASDSKELFAKSRAAGNDKDIVIVSINPAAIDKDFLEEKISIKEETDMFTNPAFSVYIAIASSKEMKAQSYDRLSKNVFEYGQTVGISVYFTSLEAAKAFFNELVKATNP